MLISFQLKIFFVLFYRKDAVERERHEQVRRQKEEAKELKELRAKVPTLELELQTKVYVDVVRACMLACVKGEGGRVSK